MSNENRDGGLEAWTASCRLPKVALSKTFLTFGKAAIDATGFETRHVSR